MQNVLIVIHLFVVLALVGVVLLQRSEGGALGMGGGGGVSGFMTGRGQANALTRATAILAAIFFATSLLLALVANTNKAPRSILPTVPAPAAPAPGGTTPSQPGGVFDRLQRLQTPPAAPPASTAPAPAAPAPAAPAPAAPAPAAPAQ
jgi:preprotein translocase subunit SecG